MRHGFSLRNRGTPVICHPKINTEPRHVTKSLAIIPVTTRRSVFSQLPTITRETPQFLKIKTSKTDGEKTPIKTYSYCFLRDYESKKLIIKTLPWNRVKGNEIPQLFTKKCQICFGYCDFRTPSQDYLQKKIKQNTFLELTDFFNDATSTKRLTFECLSEAFRMFISNAMHPIASINVISQTDIACDLEWPHTELLYNMFITMISCPNTHQYNLQSLISESFIQNLFNMLRTPDTREQRKIAKLLAAIYERFACFSRTIKRLALEFMVAAPFDVMTQAALPAFLNFLSRCAALIPLKDLRTSLVNYVVPLSALQSLPVFSSALSDTVVAMASRDSSLSSIFVGSLLSHWPIASPNRQSLFLSSISYVLNSQVGRNTSSANLVVRQQLGRKLLARLAVMCDDPCASLSLAALRALGEEWARPFLSASPTGVHEVREAAKRAMNSHWSAAVQEAALAAFDALAEFEEEPPKCSAEKKLAMWEQLRIMAGEEEFAGGVLFPCDE